MVPSSWSPAAPASPSGSVSSSSSCPSGFGRLGLGLRLGRFGRRGLGFVLFGRDAGHGRRLERAERQERDLGDVAGLDVDDALARHRRAHDLGADRERAARARGRLNERRIAGGGRVDPKAADGARRAVDELGQDADRPAAIVVDEERYARAEPYRARLKAIVAALNRADLAVRDDHALDRPLGQVGDRDLTLESQHR